MALDIKITDGFGQNVFTFVNTSWSFIIDRKIKSWAPPSTIAMMGATGTLMQPIAFDFGRREDVFKLEGILTSLSEWNRLRTYITREWYKYPPAHLIIGNYDFDGQVTRLETTSIEERGGDYAIRFSLYFMYARIIKMFP